MQEAAKDLVKAEDEVTGDEHVGERREEMGGGESGGPALDEEDLSPRAGEEEGGAPVEAILPEGGGGDKQERACGAVTGEVKGTGEAAGITLKGEEQGSIRMDEEGEGHVKGE